jgi:hypothetical protein
MIESPMKVTRGKSGSGVAVGEEAGRRVDSTVGERVLRMREVGEFFTESGKDVLGAIVLSLGDVLAVTG